MSDQVQTTAQETPTAEVETKTTEAAPVETTETKETAAPTEAKTETTEAEKPAEEKTEPVVFDLKIPEGSVLSKDRAEKLTAYAKEKGLSPEVAQEILNRESEAVGTYFEEQKAALLAKSEAWVSEIKADKEFGGDNFNRTIELAHRSIEHFGGAELKKAMDETGLGNHPLLIKMHARIGRELVDDTMVNPNAEVSSNRERPEDVLFPTMKQK